MLRTRWQKVLADLWSNRARTLIVALAVAVGVYAVGVVMAARVLLVREFDSGMEEARSAAAIIHTFPFDDDFAERIAEIPGVEAAEGRNVVQTTVFDMAGQPQEMLLVAVPYFDHMEVDRIRHLSGAWPPGRREVLLERLSPNLIGAQVGDTLTIELDDGTIKTLTVAGIAHDPQQLGPDITDQTVGYVTPDTMGLMGLGKLFTELRIRVSERSRDREHIQSVVDQIEDQLERSGRPVLSTTIITKSTVRPFIDTVVLLLSSFGGIILLLSGFLVVNAISALIVQQVQHIGIMKLIGARRSQIVSMYLFTVLAYGAIATLVGIPLAILTARSLMTHLVADLLNVQFQDLSIPLPLVTLLVGIGLLLPLAAGLVPVLMGTRTTTHRALNDKGVGTGGYGQGLVVRALASLRTVQRPVLLAVRNTVRHKGRLAQTLLVLIAGMALFISVLSVHTSVNRTLDGFLAYHRYDVSVRMNRPYRIPQLEQAARQVEEVVEVQCWSVGGGIRLRPDGRESEWFQVYGIPAGSTWMSPRMETGRWLPKGVDRALVINTDVLDKESDLEVGDEVVLEMNGRKASWQVVGVAPTDAQGPAIYVTLEDYGHATRMPGQATHVQVVTRQHDADSQHEMEVALREHFESLGLVVRSTQTTQELNARNKLMFTIVVAFLILMALLLAAVGGLGLTTTMSINIMERIREIGVLRAIGSSNASLRRVVLAEGVMIGVLSWFFGTLLSLPVSAFMSQQVGLALLKIPLSYRYSLPAAVGWFFALLLVAAVASLGPARNAVRLTVRETLAYE